LRRRKKKQTTKIYHRKELARLARERVGQDVVKGNEVAHVDVEEVLVCVGILAQLVTAKKKKKGRGKKKIGGSRD